MEKSIIKIIEEVCEDMCTNYCKYPGMVSEAYKGKKDEGEEMLYDHICEKCPLNRLN